MAMASQADFSRTLQFHRSRASEAKMHRHLWEPQVAPRSSSSFSDILTAIRMKGRVAFPLPDIANSHLIQPYLTKRELPDLIQQENEASIRKAPPKTEDKIICHPTTTQSNEAVCLPKIQEISPTPPTTRPIYLENKVSEDRLTTNPHKFPAHRDQFEYIESQIRNSPVELTRKSNKMDLRLELSLLSVSGASSVSRVPSWNVPDDDLAIYIDNSKLSPNTSFLIDHYQGEEFPSLSTATTESSRVANPSQQWDDIDSQSSFPFEGSDYGKACGYYIESYAEGIPARNASIYSSGSFDSGTDITHETDLFISLLQSVPRLGQPSVVRCSTPHSICQGEGHFKMTPPPPNDSIEPKKIELDATGETVLVCPPQIRVPKAGLCKPTVQSKAREDNCEGSDSLCKKIMTDFAVEHASKDAPKMVRFEVESAIKRQQSGKQANVPEKNSSKCIPVSGSDFGSILIKAPVVDGSKNSLRNHHGIKRSTINAADWQTRSNILLQPECTVVNTCKPTCPASIDVLPPKQLPFIEQKATSNSDRQKKISSNTKTILKTKVANVGSCINEKKNISFSNSLLKNNRPKNIEQSNIEQSNKCGNKCKVTNVVLNNEKTMLVYRCHGPYDPYKAPLTPDKISGYGKKKPIDLYMIRNPPITKKPERQFVRHNTKRKIVPQNPIQRVV